MTSPAPHAVILVIDDEKNLLFGLQTVLKRAGYDVQTAGNGSDGLQAERVSANTIDLSLSSSTISGNGGIGLELKTDVTLSQFTGNKLSGNAGSQIDLSVPASSSTKQVSIDTGDCATANQLCYRTAGAEGLTAGGAATYSIDAMHVRWDGTSLPSTPTDYLVGSSVTMLVPTVAKDGCAPAACP